MKFLIAAPQYLPQSGGVMVLHDLCETLNAIGHTAALVFFHNGNATEQNFEFSISNNSIHHKPSIDYYKFSTEYGNEISEFLKDGIVIYPDLISGNPLNAQRTVRYVLNKNKNTFHNDYILSFSKIFHESSNFNLFRIFRNPFIHDVGSLPWTERNLNATYIGKGSSFGDCSRIKNSILIERDWPKDKEQLGLLLRQVKFFYTWDSVSATNYDAVISGCVPIFLSNSPIGKNMVDEMEPGMFPAINYSETDSSMPDGIDTNFISETLSKMKNTINSLSDKWDLRVGEFASHCENFFKSTQDNR